MIDEQATALLYTAAQADLTVPEAEDNDSRDDDFAALQAHLEPRVRRFTRRLIGVHDSEDDIVQDVFLALYKNLPGMSEERLLPFMYRVTRNRCYDVLRWQGRHETITFDDLPFDPTATGSSAYPEEVSAWSTLLDRARVAMDTLPEPQRQALILYADEGLSIDEIAQIMDVPPGTVKSRLYHARKQMRRLFQMELGDYWFGQAGDD